MKASRYFPLIIFCIILTSIFSCLTRGQWNGEFSNSFLMEGYDVVVIGAGTGGVSAAIQAARMGASVLLVEETDWIGGQMSGAGVSTMDEVTFKKDQYIRDSGIYEEFINKVKDYYADPNIFDSALGFSPPKPIETCYQAGIPDDGFNSYICLEPHVGKKVFLDMIKETRELSLPGGRQPTFTKIGNKVTRVDIDNGTGSQQINSTVLIDATEYGDILPLVGAKYRVGRSISPDINLTEKVQNITWKAIIKKYPRDWNRNPVDPVTQQPLTSDLIMDINNPPPGYNESEFSEKLVLDNGVIYMKHNNCIPGVNCQPFVTFRGMPDSSNSENYTGYTDPVNVKKVTKTGINWEPVNDIFYTVGEIENQSIRRDTNFRAKLKTLQVLFYLQNLNDSNGFWSIANDEGYNTHYNNAQNNDMISWYDEIKPINNNLRDFKSILNHFPVIPYVRESRRIAGEYSVKADDIQRDTGSAGVNIRRGLPNKIFHTSLAVGDYAIDLHAANNPSDIELDLDRDYEIPENWGDRGIGLFQIPFKAFIPVDVDGLLVAEKNISVSRLVNGATRLQPVTMLTGQAAGAIAALAIDGEPRIVNPIDVQKELLKKGSILSVYRFNDIPKDHDLWKEIQLISTYEIDTGYPQYKPAYNIKRDRISAYIIRVKYGEDFTLIDEENPYFEDVPKGHWAFRYIQKMYENGITAGCGGGHYCPDNTITIAELAALIIRAKFNKKECNNGPACEDFNYPIYPAYFEDVPPSHWAFKYVQKLYDNGIDIYGCGTDNEGNQIYCPTRIVQRSKFAQYLAISGYGNNFKYSTEQHFNDVNPEYWAFNYIQKIYEAKIFTGYADGAIFSLNPNDNETSVSKERMAGIIIRAKFGKDFTFDGNQHYQDVSNDHWNFKFIQKMYDEGIETYNNECKINGNPCADCFCPSLELNRSKAAQYFIRAIEGNPPGCGGNAPYYDVDPSNWACKFIKRLKELGISDNCDPNEPDCLYYPNDKITRGETAEFIYRALSKEDFREVQN
ncbi:MAG: FAD-dependent oxidoreductase, partial [Promethearchaeota archaeon]